MTRKKYRALVALQAFVLMFLVACKPSTVDEKTPSTESLILAEEDKNENKEISQDMKKESSEDIQKLPLVKGAKEGSRSSYVKDREVWNDFVDLKFIDQASGPIEGLHLPQITLNSKDAKAANEEIDKILEGLKKYYKDFQEVTDGDELGISSDFSAYQDDKILSLHLETSSIMEGYVTDHHIYNFSLPDGKAIDDGKLVENYGLEKDDLLSLMEESINEEYDRYTALYDNNIDDSSFIYGSKYFQGLALEDLWDKYDPSQSKVFFDQVGKANFVCQHFSAAGSGEFTAVNELMTKPINYSQYSDAYVKMARALDKNPDDYQAIVIYLGYAWDEDTLKEVLLKLNLWQAVFYDYKDPNILLNVKENPQTYEMEIRGQEYYLVVPKYTNSTISLKELDLTEDGKTKEVDNYDLDSKSLAGPTLVCQNESEVFPNAKIILKYRDEKIEFSPSISQKDGKLVVPDQILDGSEILAWEKLEKDYMYSSNIYEKILSIMGRG